MRLAKRITAVMLALLMLLNLSPIGSANAAKKPSVKKKVTVKVGKTVKVKVKNAVKNAKVTWKTSNKKVAKLRKKVTKGKKANVIIKGVKKGKAKVTATYKVGSKELKLVCKVTVKNTPDNNVVVTTDISQPTSPINLPVSTDNSDGIKSTEQPEETGSPIGEPTPTMNPTEEPTDIPVNNPTGDISLTLSADTEAITYSSNVISYNDGKANVELSYENSGYGVAYYINSDKSAEELSNYDIIYNITSDNEYQVAFASKVGIKNNDFWDYGGTEANTVYKNLSTGTKDYVFTDWSGAAQALFIQYNTYEVETTENAKFTINSITLKYKGGADKPDDTPNPGAETPGPTPELSEGSMLLALSATNEAYNDDVNKVTYSGGKANVNLSYEENGYGVAYYIKADKSAVDLSAYDIVFNITSAKDYKAVFASNNNITSSDY